MDAEITEVAQRLLSAASPASTAAEKPGFEDMLGPGREWLRKLSSEGLAVPTWPRWCGGRDATAAEAREIRRSLAQLAPPDLYPFSIGTGIVGPTMLSFGTRSQQERWLPPVARGDQIFCQMFSEPDAGSDLANVSTIARPTADGGWELKGQKVWTSRGSYADWGLCLARTDPDAPKNAGLTMFVVEMAAEGVEVRPLKQINGDEHFSEVFLDGVRVTDDQRIGELGTGWKVAVAALAHERTSIAGYGGGSKQRGTGLPNWLESLARCGALTDPVMRQRAMCAYTLERLQRWSARGISTGVGSSGPSGGKLRQVAAYKARADVLIAAAGAEGMLSEHSAMDPFLTAPSMSIRGGTDEIQRNVIAERVLGLPAEQRLDRDVPWVVSRKGLL